MSSSFPFCSNSLASQHDLKSILMSHPMVSDVHIFVPREIIDQEWKRCYLGSGKQNRKKQLGTLSWVRAEAKSIKLSAHSLSDTSFKASPQNVKFQKLQSYQRRGNTAQSLSFPREFKMTWKQTQRLHCRKLYWCIWKTVYVGLHIPDPWTLRAARTLKLLHFVNINKM